MFNSFCQPCLDCYQSLLRHFQENEQLTSDDHPEYHHSTNNPSPFVQTLAKLIRSMRTNHSTDTESFEDESRMSQLQELAQHSMIPAPATGARFGGRLQHIHVDGETEHAVEMYSSIRYRLDLALFTDQLVAHFGLPHPSEQSCLAWDRVSWNWDVVDARARWKQRKFDVDRMLDEGGFNFYPADGQGPPFSRPR